MRNAAAMVLEMVDEYGQWLWGAFVDSLPSDILLRIAAAKPPVPGLVKDFPRWLSSSNGQFTVRSAYALRVGISIGPVEPCWAVIARYKELPPYTLWSSLIRPESFFVFLELSLKDWIIAYLTQASKFVRDFAEWDLLFRSLLWLLWLWRNSMIFELEEVRWKPVLV
ncbi:hypothetical protein V6N12_069419 [Hibiscus sabdariffa]|uniref:Uncharacterized protein n=1 Tax=Hibiscus sabdariffa TaxID=183260 RepID=A0ABR2FDV0_9ROSI